MIGVVGLRRCMNAGEEMFIDLLFFNRELNSLVAVELTFSFAPSIADIQNGYLLSLLVHKIY